MRHLPSLLVTFTAALLFHAGIGWAAPATLFPPGPSDNTRWQEPVDARAASIFVHNLSGRPATATVDSQVVSLGAGGTVEIPLSQLDSSVLRLRSTVGLLVLQASQGFEPASLKSSPLTAAGGGEHIRTGVTGAVEVSADDRAARIEVAVDLLTPDTSVRVRQLDLQGHEIASVVATASRPIHWQATLDAVAGTSRVEVKTLRGESQATAAAVVPGSRVTSQRTRVVPPPKADSGGLAQFSPEINWSGNLDFYVTGGPTSMCGDLHVNRNFTGYTVTSNWICTDASGNAHAGPWSYASQSGDEEAYAYIEWANTLSTNTAHHIWDKTAPTASITSSNGPPAPTSFSGTASDPNYGAGFDSSWATCTVYFYDKTTDDYWSSGCSYANAHFPYVFSCTFSGMPSRSVTWSQSTLPPGCAHISHHCYEWGVYVWDGGHQSSIASESFCIP